MQKTQILHTPARRRFVQHSLTAIHDVDVVRRLAAIAVLISIAFAAAMGEVINRDGVLYVRTAQAFLDGGVTAAMNLYNWPAYPILFGLLSKWSGLSLEAAAHVINAGCMLLLVDSFIRLCHQLDKASPRPWIFALIVLSFPPLDHRLEIYRDWGYLALAMCAFVPLLRFWQAEDGRARDALAWQGAILAALLFRVEAAALMVLAPLCLLVQDRPWPQRWRRFATANSVLVLIAVVGMALIASGALPAGKLLELSMYLDIEHVTGSFNYVARQISAYALNKYAADFASHMLLGGLLTMVAWMTLANLGGLLVFLTAIGLFRQRLPSMPGYRLVYWLLAIIGLTLFVFLATRLITVNRYAMLASLLTMTLTAYYASRFPARRPGERVPEKLLRWITVGGLVIGMAINIAALPDYKAYLRSAGQWINSSVPSTATVLTNDLIIDYYAGREPGKKLDTVDKLKQEMASTPPPYYVALKLKEDERSRAELRLFPTPPVKEFHSSRARERVAVFYIPASHP